MKYSEQDMAKLISEVEVEFKEYLAKAEQTENTEEVNFEENASEDTDLNKSEPAKGFDYDEDDIQEMNQMYSSMNKAEQAAHYAAIKKSLFGESEEDAGTDLNKSETEDKEVLLKAEFDSVKGDLEASKKENEELKKNLETLTSIVSKIVKKAPARKAVTQLGGIQVIKKSEEPVVENEDEVDVSKLSKAEINKILSKKIRDGEIKKTEDKEKINMYCHGQIKVDKIKHLL